MSMKRSAQNLLAAAFAILATTAAAQAPSVAAGAGDELRAVFATSADVAEGKHVAESSCNACHGASGISRTPEVPHLAGQRAAYLYVELRAYKQGTRDANPMASAVKFLSDDAMMKAAAYFASLDPAPSAPAAAKSATKPDPMQAGKAAAAACAGCHGDDGVSRIPGTPSLGGLDPKYLAGAMAAYKSGGRKHDMMKSLVAALGEADMNNIALYYALQKPAKAAAPAAGDAAAGKAAATACAGCHGEQGVSATAGTPSLAGQDAQYLAAAARAYKDGTRGNETMKGPAAALDEKSANNVAAYFAAQTPQAPKVRKPLSVAEIAERCDRCHGTNGNSTDPRAPALASQRAEYLEKALLAYRTGTRKSTAMAAMSDMLSESDVQAVAAHYARQKARPVVYVQVPTK
jgi:cytochrome c553